MGVPTWCSFSHLLPESWSFYSFELCAHVLKLLCFPESAPDAHKKAVSTKDGHYYVLLSKCQVSGVES